MSYKFKQLIHNIKDFFKYMDKKYLVIFGIIIVGIISTILIISFKNTPKRPNDTSINEVYNLVLFGPDEVSIYKGDTYKEIGYYATLNNKLITDNVKVSNQINSNKLGEYVITYSISNLVKTRIVKVIEKNDVGVSNVKLEIIGNVEVDLTVGDTYHDAGCQAFDKDMNNISNKIQVDNPVNTNKTGVYYITYSITLDNETKTAKRLVIVHPKANTSNNNSNNNSNNQDTNYNLDNGNYGNTSETSGVKVDTLNIKTNYSTSYTKNNIKINITASGDNLSYIKLPDGKKVYTKNTTYEATTNGTYYFYAYDTNNNYNVTIARITTIDKTAPTITCKANFVNSTTTITVDAKDNSGISYYNYASKYKSAIPNIVINEILDKDYIVVTAYDMAGNFKSAKCTTPKSSGNLEIHFIAGVSDDDAILIRNNDTTIMIDGGRWDARSKVVSYLQKAGVTTIDALIGSHVHWNHVQSQAAILDNFNVKKAYYSTDPRNCVSKKECESNDVKYIKDKLNSKGTDVVILKNSSFLEFGDIKLYFIGPNRKLTTWQNANSLVFILKYINNSFMFTGDTPDSYMNANTFTNNMKYFNINNIDIDVLKWPHHGYEDLTDSFFKATTPKYAIIPNCCYCSSKYPSSNNKSLMKKYGTTYYQVCDSKNIVLISNGNDIEIKTNQQPENYKR